MHAKI